MATDERGEVLATSTDGQHRVRVLWDENVMLLAEELGDDGGAWGYIVERRTIWRQDYGPRVTMETWEHVDSTFGIYGRSEAERMAREALEQASEGGSGT